MPPRQLLRQIRSTKEREGVTLRLRVSGLGAPSCRCGRGCGRAARGCRPPVEDHASAKELARTWAPDTSHVAVPQDVLDALRRPEALGHLALWDAIAEAETPLDSYGRG